jgi:hypothetical protein
MIEREHKQMSMWGKKKGAKTRIRQGYRSILKACIGLLKLLIQHEEKHLEKFSRAAHELCAWLRRKYEKVQSRYRAHFSAIFKVLTQANLRVFHKKQLPAIEKFLSMKDPDAAMISKGQRDVVLGYKIQFAFNALGYASAGLINHGNASDSESLVDQRIKREKTAWRGTLECPQDEFAAKSPNQEKSGIARLTWGPDLTTPLAVLR